MRINEDNINGVFSKAMAELVDIGVESNSRNGSVIVAPAPCTLTYRRPTERVLFSPKRNCNPFFHLMESLWMLGGRNDLAWLKYFNSRFGEYSDDGATIRGAYGHRWRKHFKFDQLAAVVGELRENPTSRRAVLAMYDPVVDTSAQTKDMPCNTHAYFDLRGDRLNMTVLNRSNDAIWGAFGANAVHFSVLQEYLAAWLQTPIGFYTQFTNNLHFYTEVYSKADVLNMAAGAGYYDYYRTGAAKPFQLVNGSIESWDADLHHFLADPAGASFSDVFFRGVAQPMYQAWSARKNGSGTGMEQVDKMQRCDWQIACKQWIQRKEEANAKH